MIEIDKTKENLFKAFEVIMKSMPMPFDQAKVGRIVEKLNNNRYKVQIQGGSSYRKIEF